MSFRSFWLARREHGLLWKDLALAGLTVSGLGTTHYLGFLNEIPEPLRSTAGTSLASGFFKTLGLHVSIAIFFSLIFREIIISIYELRPCKQRSNTESQTPDGTQKAERVAARPEIVSSIQVPATLLFFCYTYVGLGPFGKSSSQMNYVDIGAISSVILLIIFGSTFFVMRNHRAKSSYWKTIRAFLGLSASPQRSRQIRKMISLLVTALAVLAYLIGLWRLEYVQRKDEVLIQDERISHRFNIILKSGAEMLLFQRTDDFEDHPMINKVIENYVYVTPEIIVYTLPNGGTLDAMLFDTHFPQNDDMQNVARKFLEDELTRRFGDLTDDEVRDFIQEQRATSLEDDVTD